MKGQHFSIHDTNTLCMQASLEQTVAAMRFFLAYQSATTWQSQGLLSEDDFLNKLHEWAVTSPTSTRCCLYCIATGLCAFLGDAAGLRPWMRQAQWLT